MFAGSRENMQLTDSFSENVRGQDNSEHVNHHHTNQFAILRVATDSNARKLSLEHS